MGPSTIPEGPMSTTLVDLLSNSLVLRQTAPYLPVSTLYAIAATCKTLYQAIYHSREAFRYMDLSVVKSAVVPHEPLDFGGISWRAERMDESLTEDEFYSGALRGIFSKLERRHFLRNVQTLVLDGLSVPADLVREIIAEDRFNVRILSIREVKNLNERKLMQVLRYTVRPTRPKGTPRVKGIYLFGPRDPAPVVDTPNKKKLPLAGMRCAGIGAQWNHRSSETLNTALARTEDKWYQNAGRLLPRRPSLEWAETLKACEGIIAFDAVLCRGPRHNPSNARITQSENTGGFNQSSFLNPAIATVALGPSGCETCHSSPEGPAVFGQSPISSFPLLTPVPLHSTSIRATQMPHTIDGGSSPPLIVRCEDCLKGRWCERCHKWWDESCYTASAIAQRTQLQLVEFNENIRTEEEKISARQKFKVVIGVRRDCFGCGHTCHECKEVWIRRCEVCRTEYCIEDNDSETKCDWCNYTLRGARTVEMY
ncbi:hypothetical protein GQ43DRAFT_420698 [Delitschia confertaspora ATCC 74209]|uniref:F-box domain-containing protein n=1 Tax=Delitschia confertaspora ATCC 74209 TaxID=1513339 RepID=A0A9P4JLB2_9PLEO|nr:hypothetical protein GQ43DRAFT_420698 [Delitschia confertaspora ATCC 74209]